MPGILNANRNEKFDKNIMKKMEKWPRSNTTRIGVQALAMLRMG